ncbi:hypothetical protein [Longimicrobium terrae]|uniref:Uncharacterized protein n=1 Tax=Longimicrobium terrae TaxID=1639882 RepID=A0A841H6Q9_9BACT|nr:hypothetical protein [Longimicrobium terrae]MBB4638208.1 hypothetical protein [Longimicrobium terrae]MBB6073633.1 hypothetical protein [Longimicrobium terrae]NNC30313.1 hypothetical protein [Longimicrobium terrae]
MRHLWAVLILLCAGAADLAAQEASAIAPGTRVRVTQTTTPEAGARGRRNAVRVGTLLAVDSGSVTIQQGGQSTVVPLALVSRLEVSAGTASGGRGTLRAAGIGALVGAGATALTVGVIQLGGTDDCDNCADVDEDFLGSPPVVVGVGALIGAAVGAFVGGLSHEKWSPVTVSGRPATVSLSTTARGIGLELRF